MTSVSDFLEGAGKFIDGLVRPSITFGLAAAAVFMAIILKDHDAGVAVLTMAATAVSFWFGTRTQDKAQDTAAKVATALAEQGIAPAGTAGATTPAVVTTTTTATASGTPTVDAATGAPYRTTDPNS